MVVIDFLFLEMMQMFDMITLSSVDFDVNVYMISVLKSFILSAIGIFCMTRIDDRHFTVGHALAAVMIAFVPIINAGFSAASLLVLSYVILTIIKRKFSNTLSVISKTFSKLSNKKLF